MNRAGVMATNPDYKAEKGEWPTYTSVDPNGSVFSAHLTDHHPPMTPTEKCAAFFRSFQSVGGDGFKYLNMLVSILNSNP